MNLPLAWPWLVLAVGMAVVVAVGSARVIQGLARRWKIVDRVERAPHRKHQSRPIPLLGGLAIYISFVCITGALWEPLTQGYLLPKHLVGLWLAGGVIMIGGWLDDWKQLRPGLQIIFPLLAAGIIILSGIGINYITNPFGGVLSLQQWDWTVFIRQGIPYRLTLWADLFTLLWLLTSSYTTKILDGLDGLVPGVGIIGALIVALVSFTAGVNQPETGVLSLVFAAACAGFLVWNWSPAKMYLGEGGSVFIGFMLGVLAIISGGKIATALLILGLPLIDIVWVVFRRLIIERRSPFRGDTLHLHFQLKRLGWSDRQIVALYYFLISSFGISTIWLHGQTKVIVLSGLVVVTVSLLVWLHYYVQRHHVSV